MRGVEGGASLGHVDILVLVVVVVLPAAFVFIPFVALVFGGWSDALGLELRDELLDVLE